MVEVEIKLHVIMGVGGGERSSSRFTPQYFRYGTFPSPGELLGCGDG